MKDIVKDYEKIVQSYKDKIQEERIRAATLTHEIQNVLDAYNNVKPTDIKFADILSLPINVKVQIADDIVYERKSDTLLIAYLKKGAYVRRHIHSDFDEFFTVKKGTLLCNVTGEVLEQGKQYYIPNGLIHSHTAIEDVINEIKLHDLR